MGLEKEGDCLLARCLWPACRCVALLAGWLAGWQSRAQPATEIDGNKEKKKQREIIIIIIIVIIINNIAHELQPD